MITVFHNDSDSSHVLLCSVLWYNGPSSKSAFSTKSSLQNSDLYLLEIHSQKRQKYLLMCAKIRLLADLLIYIAFCALF